MDTGIIRNFKLKYKAQFVQWLLDMVTAGTEDKKFDVLSAIRMVAKSWAEVRPETIRHCWIYTGIMSGVMAAVLRRQDEPVRPNDLLILANLIDKLSLSDGMDADDYLECDNNLEDGNQTPMKLPPLSHFRLMTTATETKISSSLIATR